MEKKLTILICLLGLIMLLLLPSLIGWSYNDLMILKRIFQTSRM